MCVGFPRWLSGKRRRCAFDPWGENIPLEEKMETHTSFLAWTGKSHGQESLAGYSPWGCKTLDMTEQLNTHAYVIYISLSIYLSIYEQYEKAKRYSTER